jgi:hypothetical protein
LERITAQQSEEMRLWKALNFNADSGRADSGFRFARSVICLFFYRELDANLLNAAMGHASGLLLACLQTRGI